MSEIVWGDPIEVGGKRPEWLRDGDMQWDDLTASFGWERWSHGCKSVEVRTDFTTWLSVGAIRLPADHFAYLALSKGFVPWGGGETAPEDWDGGPVLWGRGVIHEAANWGRKPEWEDEKLYIIGYKRKAVQPAATASQTSNAPSTSAVDHVLCKLCKRIWAVVPLGVLHKCSCGAILSRGETQGIAFRPATPAAEVEAEWVPDERTVRACIEALPIAREDTPTDPKWIRQSDAVRALESLLPKPDPVKALAEEWNNSEECAAWMERVGAPGGIESFARWLVAEGKLVP